MAKIKPEQAYAKEIFDGFHGVNSDALVGGKGASDMRNFRILPDGSLQKRCGWRSMISFPETVRGFWQGTLGESSFCFVAAGTQVYRVEGLTDSLVTTLDSDSGRVRFFVYRDRLYLMDGSSLLIYNSSADSFEAPSGYAPLYGRNWHPTDMGSVNEPFNLLSKHLRVHYLNTTGSTTFKLPYYADSIDQIRVDGKLTTDYTMLTAGNGFTLGSASAGGSVEVAFSVSLFSEVREQLLQVTCAFVDQEGSLERLVLYGSSQGNRLFCATAVDDHMLNASKAIWSDSDPLYFTHNAVLLLGDASRPITSMFRNHGRLLAFHREGAYAVHFSDSDNGVEVYPLLHGMGCEAKDAELYLETDPVVVNSGGIFRLHSTAGEPDTFEATCLSENVPALHGNSFAMNALVCEDLVHGELWFCDQSEGIVWVYRSATKEWTVFDNIQPSFFFHMGCDVGFASRSAICLFNELLSTDGGLPFTAYYRTGYLTFGCPETVKRSLRASLTAHSGGNELDVEMRSELCTKTFSAQGKDTSLPELIDRRVTLGRFRFLRVTLRDSGSARSRIYRLALFANL